MQVNEIKLTQHPLRKQLYAEIHSRPFPRIKTSVHAFHFAFLTAPSEALEQLGILDQIALEHRLTLPDKQSNCYYSKLPDYELRWEKHQEFCTLTFIQETKPKVPFDNDCLSQEQIRLLEHMPGELVVALRVHLERESQQPDPIDILKYFDEYDIYGSTIVGDKASMWSSFQLHSDDYARMLIYDKGLSDYQAGRTLQRVIEIETYLRLALLALPPARTLMPKIAKLNIRLTKLIKGMRPDVNTDIDEHKLLKNVSKYAAQIEDYRSATTHRFAATDAYYRLIGQRLDDLREESWPGFSSWKKMLQRRLIPAVQTCTAINNQLHSLSTQAERANDLLRTRVDMNIEDQNQKLLQSIDRRSELQLRLQQMVEGLSVVAISYYTLGLVKMIAEGVVKLGFNIEPSIVVAVLAIPVLLGTAWLIRRVRHKINKNEPD